MTATTQNVLISPKFKPQNPFSWNTEEVYAASRLLLDMQEKFKVEFPNLCLCPREVLWDLWCDYGRNRRNYISPDVFEAATMVINGGWPYQIGCQVAHTGAGFNENLYAPENWNAPASSPFMVQFRATCHLKVYLDLPPVVEDTHAPDESLGGLFALAGGTPR